MASTAAPPNGSAQVSAKVDELRGVLASKGLKVKDSLLARLAKSKSFKGLTTAENLVVPEDAEPVLANSAQEEADTQIDTAAQNGDGAVASGKILETLIPQKPKQDFSDSTAELLGSCESSRKGKNGDSSPSSPTSGGGKRLPFTEAGLQSNSEQERKQCRPEHFGTVSEDEKLQLRAARFGIVNDAKEEAEKKRARAARFGIIDEDAKKKARLERFGKESEQENKEENEKRKARALRFATTVEGGAVEGQG